MTRTAHDAARWAREVAVEIDTHGGGGRKVMSPADLRLLADAVDARVTDAEAELATLRTLLLLFGFEECDQMWWRGEGASAKDGPLSFHVTCSDTFMWGCADLETIELPGDLATLRQAFDDLPEGDWPLLWVCRKRGMRPMNRYMEQMYGKGDEPAEKTLIEAAGPPRESEFGAP